MIYSLSFNRETRPTRAPEPPATANSTVRRLAGLLKNETARAPVNADPIAQVNADHQEAPFAIAPAAVFEESAAMSHLVDLNKPVAFDGEDREVERRVALQLGAPRQNADAAAGPGFAMEIARV